MNKKLEITFLTTILIIYLCLYLFVAINIPVDGDGALHAGTVEVISKTGSIIDFHPYTLTDGTQHLPIFYPKLFYTETAILKLFLGDYVYKIIVPLFGVITSIFIFLFSKKIFESYFAGLLSTIVTLSSYGLINNSVEQFRMETMVILLAIASIYFFIKFTEKSNKELLVLSIIFFSGCISTKQQAYIYTPVFIFIVFNKLVSNIKYKLLTLGVFFLASVSVASPVLIEEFISTGTLFYPGIPLVGKIENKIAEIFNINFYKVGEGWVKYAVGSDRVLHLHEMYSTPSNHLMFLNPFSEINRPSLLITIYTLFAIGLIVLIIKREYYIILFLLLQQTILFIQPLDRYFLLNQIIAACIIGGGITIFKYLKLYNRIPMYTYTILIIFLSVFSTSVALTNSYKIPNYSYGRFVPDRLDAEKKAGDWLKENTPENSVIITPRTHVFSYYSRRDALWLNQIGGKDIYEAFLNNDTESIYKISDNYKYAYIVIPKYWVINSEAEGKWIPFVEQKTIDKISEDKNIFQNIYENDKIVIYKKL